MAEAPIVNDVVVREFIRGLMRRSESYSQTVVLLDGRYDPNAPTEMVVDGVPVRVADCPSVLAAMQACLDHRLASGFLVLLTTRPEEDLGADLCARAVKHRRLPVHRWEIVLHRFGARELDPRLRRLRWVADGLLEAEPTQGWPKLPGSMLDYDTAMRQLISRRLDVAADLVDATELLTLGPAQLAGLDRLRPDERDGLSAWLAQSVGPAAAVMLQLTRYGHAADALAFGLVAAALWDARPADTKATSGAVSTDLARAQGRAQGRAEAFLGAWVETPHLLAFAEAAHGVVTRWLTSADGTTPADAEHRHRIESVLHRADQMLSEFGADDLADRGELLTAGLRARLRTLAAAVNRAVDGANGARAAMEAALDRVVGHELLPLRGDQVTPAVMAARLVRWLAEPESPPRTVIDGVTGQARTWGWVDRALATLWFGEPTADPETASVYARVHDTARDARDRLDATFADRLAAWTSGSAAPTDLLLIEHVLDRVAVPLVDSGQAPPLILVVDGMSAAVAAQLAEQVRSYGLTEVVRDPGGREGAVAVIPSVTAVSRTSLLCGRLADGAADTERTGFAAFWRQRGLDAALFHKADLPGGAGQRLAPGVLAALSRIDDQDRAVIGVVLNSVDDALDHGREGGRVDWNLADVTFLPELLAAARSYGRPVLLVADHGHVLERERGAPSGEDSTSSRWRPATEPAGDGEIELAGDRVLRGGGRIIAPWRETIRYTARKAGYHGGASLAEMVVPLLIFVPAVDAALPDGWHLLPPERTTPSWWAPRPATTDDAAAMKPRAGSPRPRKAVTPQHDTLFDELPAPVPNTLGQRVVGSATYKAQQRYVRKPPTDKTVATIIDTLARSGDRLSVTALAELAATPSMRVPGLIAMLRSLLNVESYPVLTLIDGGQTLELNQEMLHSQFKVGSVQP